MADTTEELETSQPQDDKFTSILLDTDEGKKRKKQPRRVIHFSDGVLEEYSSDDEEDSKVIKEIVDPRMLTWGPWLMHYSTTVFKKVHKSADFCGGKLAWFLGITTPKYKYEIEEYKRRQREIEKDKEDERKQREKAQGLSTVEVQYDNTAADSDRPETEPTQEGEKY